MKSPTFIASLDAKRLCLLLEASYVGQLITYKEMSSAIGRDVQTEARAALNSARRIVQRELSYVFGTVPNEGLKRLNDVEIVQTGAQTVKSIRHASGRGIKRIAAADPSRLPVDSRIQMNTYLSVLGMLHVSLQEKRIKALEQRVAQAESRLPLNATLDSFKNELAQRKDSPAHEKSKRNTGVRLEL